jgi:hypothetical protein
VEGQQPKDRDRIEAAVENCVGDAIKSERPFRHVNDFLSLLRRAGWRDAEILEVQTRVLEAFKKKRQSG